jgi:type I restriction enzyme S subunit
MSWGKVKLSEVLKQYRIEHLVQNDIEYKQVTISKYDGVTFRGTKIGKEIGRKRQFQIDLKKYPNTLMFVRQGVQDGSIGIANSDVDGCIATENMPMFSIETIDVEYLRFILKSPYFNDELKKIATTGSAQKSIHERQILEIEIPYPNPKEQKKIVNELSKLKDNSNSISTELTHQLTLVKKLRQQLLQDAVKGKLVEQNKKDEPASELLKKIKAEKEKLIAEKKLKKEKELAPIKAEEIPFEIPVNWVWCRGEIVATYIDPQPSHRTPPESTDGIPYIAMSDIRKDGSLDFNSARKVSNTTLAEHQNRYKLKEGDFIFGKIGTIGKPVKLLAPFNYTLSANVILIQPERRIVNQDYLFYFLSSPAAEKNLIENKSTMSYPVFGMGKARNMPIPLPPLSEQIRIVQKLDELMQYCNSLEASIKQSAAQNERLLQQVLREALRKEPVEA